MIRLSLSLIFLAALLPVGSFAQTDPKVASSPSAISSPKVEQPDLFLEQQISLSFEPQKIFFVLRRNNHAPEILNGIALPAPVTNLQSDTADSMRTWIIGLRLNKAQPNERLEYSIFLRGADQELELIPPNTIVVDQDLIQHSSVDWLRDQLVSEKEKLKSWQVQQEAQEENLQRLRSDADLIGNLGRIIEVKEEVSQVQQLSSKVDLDIQNMQQALKLLRTYPTPKSYLIRETQLTRQLAELADAAKQAESGESGRKSANQVEMGHKLALIESTRNEDYDQLNKELVKLRRRRMQLEREHVQTATPSPTPKVENEVHVED